VKLLLNHKCDPNICDQYGRVPLYIASRHGHTEIVELLLNNKANPYIILGSALLFKNSSTISVRP
jgi:ankyrin repeat protein